MDDSLQTIIEIFENFKFHHILVVEKQKLVGVISDRDLLGAISPFLNTLSEKTCDMYTLNRRAHQIMSRDIITAFIQTSIETAARLLLNNNIGVSLSLP